MALGLITLNTEYYPDPGKGVPISIGSIYIGNPDTDPQDISNRVDIVIRQEDGTDVPILPAAQPINTGQGGTAIYNGSPVQLLVEGNYSIKVNRADGTPAYYIANAIAGTPVQRTDVIPLYKDIATLRSTGVKTDLHVKITSHTTDGDNGHGEFYWDNTAGSTDDNGSIIKLPGESAGRFLRLKERTYRVAQFGGFPGAQDSFNAFTAAVAAANGESVLIDPGTYSVASGDFSAYEFHSFGEVLFSDNTTFIIKRITSKAFIKFHDLKVGLGLDGGDSVIGVQKRTLILDFDETGLASISNSVFTLPKGKWKIKVRAPAQGASSNYISLYSETQSKIVLYGSNSWSLESTGSAQTDSTIESVLTSLQNESFRIDHYFAFADVNGLGVSKSGGELNNIYTEVFLELLG